MKLRLLKARIFLVAFFFFISSDAVVFFLLLSVIKKKKKQILEPDVMTMGACLELSQRSRMLERERKEAVCAGVCSFRNTETEVSAKTCVCEWMAARL